MQKTSSKKQYSSNFIQRITVPQDQRDRDREGDRQIDRQTAAAAAKGTKKLTEKEKDRGRCFYRSRSSYEKESALARRKRRSEQHRSSLAMVGRCVLLHCDEEEEEDDVR